jgi:hypothetical protein
VKPFNSITISPLYKNQTTIIVLDTDSSYLSFSVFLKNDKYKSLEILNRTITKPGKYIYTYDNAQTRTKNQIYIKYKASENGEYKTSDLQQFNIVIGTTRYVSSEEALETVGTLGVFKSDLSFETVRITYNFEGFDDYYGPDYFNKLNLNDYHIRIDQKYHPFLDSTITLVIKTEDNIFKDCGGMNNGGVFNLRLVEKDDYYTFELANTYYVNPVTHLMSSEPKNGYVQTNNIFFPINDIKNQDKYEAYFAMRNFGIDKDYLIHKFGICAANNLMGDCFNSQYCVVRETL